MWTKARKAVRSTPLLARSATLQATNGSVEAERTYKSEGATPVSSKASPSGYIPPRLPCCPPPFHSPDEPYTGEALWEALDQMGPENEWQLPSYVDPTKVAKDSFIYKDRECSGSIIFSTIEYCADIQECSAPSYYRKVHRCEDDCLHIMRGVLAARADPDAEADHKLGTMKAMHYAAGTGVIPALQALVEASVSVEQSGILGKDALRRRALNVRSKAIVRGKSVRHYAPIHDAVWFHQEEATEWLLKNDADPNEQNNRGWTPMHIVAQSQNYRLVNLLVNHRARLDLEDKGGATPLQRAVQSPTFPVTKFHLLAPSCRGFNNNFLSYLKDAEVMASENAEAAEIFLQVLLGKHEEEKASNDLEESFPMTPSTTLAYQTGSATQAPGKETEFMRSVDTATAKEGSENRKAISWMAAILDKAPRAGSMLLETLIGEPLVQNPQHHPLPQRANLDIDGGEATMKCEYQPDSICMAGTEADGKAFVRASMVVQREEHPGPTSSHQKRRRFATRFRWFRNTHSSSKEFTPSSTYSEISGTFGIDLKPYGEVASGNKQIQRAHSSGEEGDTPRSSSVRVAGIVVGCTQRLVRNVTGATTSSMVDRSLSSLSEYRRPCWNFNSAFPHPAPTWHNDLAPLPADRNDDREVRIEVLKMPDLLDLRIVCVLAKTDHIELFREKTVQGIVNCLWHKLVKYSVYTRMILDTLVLLNLGVWIAAGDERLGLATMCCTVALATCLREFVHVGHAAHSAQSMKLGALSSVGHEIVLTLTLLRLVSLAWSTNMTVPSDGWGRGYLAINVLMRWLEIMYTCRAVPYVGPKIVCVLKSVFPMKEMLLVTSVVFFGFGCSAILVRGPADNNGEHTGAMILMNLFKALLMGDGDGFDELTTLSGADPDGIFVHVLVLGATMIFTVCVLNLLIAVYSNEYSHKHKQARMLFYQERCGIAYRYMLEPMWPTWSTNPAWLWRFRHALVKAWKTWRPSVLAKLLSRLSCCCRCQRARPEEDFVKAVVVVAVLLLCALAWLLSSLFFVASSVLVSLAMLLLELGAQRCDWEHPSRSKDGAHFYLWICSRVNFATKDAEELEIEDINESIIGLASQLKLMSRTLDRHLEGFSQRLEAYENSMEEVSSKVATVQEGMDALQELIQAPKVATPAACSSAPARSAGGLGFVDSSGVESPLRDAHATTTESGPLKLPTPRLLSLHRAAGALDDAQEDSLIGEVEGDHSAHLRVLPL